MSTPHLVSRIEREVINHVYHSSYIFGWILPVREFYPDAKLYHPTITSGGFNFSTPCLETVILLPTPLPPRDKLCALWKENRKDQALAEWKDFLKYLEYYAQPLAMTFQSWVL